MDREELKNKTLSFLLFAVSYTALYIYPNFRPIFAPAFLPLLSIDANMPFLPWTFFIYTSDYILFAIIIIVLKGEAFLSFARMMFFTLFICGMFFLFYPTIYPRPVYPEVDSAFLGWVMQVVGAADKPTNCFPSMHVALTSVAAWCSRAVGKRIAFGFWIWALAIFVSTMTTKQHYFMDIVGGLSVFGVVTLLEWALFEKRVFQSSGLFGSR